MNGTMATYLLSIRGTLSLPTTEASRQLHNETAGAPASVAAAQSLGDLSHMVYVSAGQNGSGGEFLILDIWNNIDGLNQFFANPHVQEQAGKIFTQRDPVVWQPAEGFYTYHFPAPFGKDQRIVTTTRGMLSSLEAGQAIHNNIVGQSVNTARQRGNLSHDVYLRLAAPGSPESLEFFAVDVWMDAAGMQEQFSDPEFLGAIGKLFVSQPMTGVWTHPAGEWVEW